MLNDDKLHGNLCYKDNTQLSKFWEREYISFLKHSLLEIKYRSTGKLQFY